MSKFQEFDWIVDPATNCANSSDEFKEIVDVVTRIIKDSAFDDLMNGRVHVVAGLIVAKLAHGHGFMPRLEIKEVRMSNRSLDLDRVLVTSNFSDEFVPLSTYIRKKDKK